MLQIIRFLSLGVQFFHERVCGTAKINWLIANYSHALVNRRTLNKWASLYCDNDSFAPLEGNKN